MYLCTEMPNFNKSDGSLQNALAIVLKYCYSSRDFAFTHSVTQQGS